jgi:hypothetical protein
MDRLSAAGTTAFQLVSDATATPSTDGTQTIHFTSDVFTAAQLTAGTRFVFPLPAGDTAGGNTYERYLGLQTVQATEGEDDLTIDAFLSLDPASSKRHYPDASN